MDTIKTSKNIRATKEVMDELSLYCQADVIRECEGAKSRKYFIMSTGLLQNMSIDEAIEMLQSAKARGCEYTQAFEI